MAAREGGMGGGTGLINSQVAWDLNGNLTRRKDLQQSPNITEDIYYDNLNRFDESKRTVGTGIPTTNQNVTLDAIGNISWKLGVGNYAYHATQKRAVVSAGSSSFGYDANGNMNARNGSSIGYTSYNLPNVINSGSSSSSISYGAFRNRYKQVSSGSIAETTIYVAGLLEKVTRGSVTEYRHLIAGSKGIAAIYTRRSDATNSTYYVHSDHLGSPELVTDSAGTEVVRLSFAAYGERRDKDWDGPVSAPDLTALANVSRHGFTGHEHLDAVGLIHMNGRVYEPVAGRFLGVDPIVQLGSSQSPNSYSYVWNNPLTLIDPSGFNPPDATDSFGPPWNCGGRLMCSDLGDLLGAGPTPLPQYFPPHVSRHTDHTGLTSPRAPGGIPGVMGDVGPSWTGLDVTSPQGRQHLESLSVDGLAHLVGEGAHVGEFAGFGIARYWVRDDMWRGINGKWNRISWGGNGANGARSAVVGAASAFSKAGHGLGVFAVVVSGGLATSSVVVGDWRGASQYTADAAVGVIMLVGGPVGIGFGAVYFAIRHFGDAYEIYEILAPEN